MKVIVPLWINLLEEHPLVIVESLISNIIEKSFTLLCCVRRHLRNVCLWLQACCNRKKFLKFHRLEVWFLRSYFSVPMSCRLLLHLGLVSIKEGQSWSALRYHFNKLCYPRLHYMDPKGYFHHKECVVSNVRWRVTVSISCCLWKPQSIVGHLQSIYSVRPLKLVSLFGKITLLLSRIAKISVGDKSDHNRWQFRAGTRSFSLLVMKKTTTN